MRPESSVSLRRARLAAAASLALLLVVPSARAEQVWISGYGTKTCGEALTLVQQRPDFLVLFTDYAQAWMSSLNWQNSKSVGRTVSGDSLSQLLLARCRQPENITRQFFLVADDIYRELERSRQ